MTDDERIKAEELIAQIRIVKGNDVAGVNNREAVRNLNNLASELEVMMQKEMKEMAEKELNLVDTAKA